MRVLLLSQAYHGGGAERCARELFENLPSVGVETELWLGQPAAGLPPRTRVIRSQAERCLYPLSLLPAINDWRHFGSRHAIDAIRPSDFDVVHIHNLHGHWISIRAVKRLCERMPVVWTLHDEWAATRGIPYDLTRVLSPAAARRQAGWIHPLVLCYPGVHSKRWRRFLSSTEPPTCQIIIPSSYLRDLTISSQCLPGSKIRHIPYGLTLLDEPSIKTNQYEARLHFGLPQTTPVVALVAAQLWSPFKGVSLALDALAHANSLLETNFKLTVLMLGRGATRAAEAINRSVSVVTAYASTPADLALAYRSADVILQPSVADNFPYVVLEAFACQRPVVAFRIGGLPEMIGENERGLLVEPFDTAGMAHELVTLLTNPKLRSNLGVKATKWVTKISAMETYLTAIRTVYEAVHRSRAPSITAKLP